MLHRTHIRLAVCLALAAPLVLGGCFVVDPQHRDDVLSGGGTDAGPGDGGEGGGDAGTDAGGSDNLLVNGCAVDGADYEILRDSRSPFIVDTRDLDNSISSCGSAAAPGHDGFLAVEVTAGDLWHFHVIPDPSMPEQDRDPFLYLLFAPGGTSCDTRACEHQSNACLGGGDEHFAFTAPEDGIWYLGIDDVNPGGGVYQIEAIRLLCGDSVKVHGEACDGSANCNSSCQEVLNEERTTEREANDNEIEANFVQLPAATHTLTLGGNIGGDSCTYPYVYNFVVDDDDSTLDVEILKSDGSLCDNGSLTPFDLVLRNSAGEIRAGPTTNATTGCAELHVSNLGAAAYFLYLEHQDPIDSLTAYRVRISVTPP